MGEYIRNNIDEVAGLGSPFSFESFCHPHLPLCVRCTLYHFFPLFLSLTFYQVIDLKTCLDCLFTEQVFVIEAVVFLEMFTGVGC